MNDYSVIRIKATLMNVYKKEQDVLKRYGSVLGDTITRTFLVPDDIPLWALHYALTTAFGFMNEHLHAFRLTGQDIERLIGNNAGTWYGNVGKLFRSPFMEDDFWADDYTSGSFKTWRRKKYTGPYVYHGTVDTYKYCRISLEKELNPDDAVSVVFSLDDNGNEYCSGADFSENPFSFADPVRKEKRAFKDLSTDTLIRLFERDYNSLLETLTVRQVFEKYTHRIIYNYDFGDDWNIMLEFSDEVNPRAEMEKCVETHCPVMLAADGLNLVEDAGGPSGYAKFLLSLYGSPRDRAVFEGDGMYMDYTDDYLDESFGNFENREDALDWAGYLEWKEKNPQLSSWF